MDKKQRISWGVSFGSLALVAGMVSYLGLANSGNANNQMSFNQGQLPDNNSNLPSEDGFNSQQGPGPDQGFDNSTSGENSLQFNQNDQASGNNFDNGSGQSFGNSDQQDQFSNSGGSGHHHGFDTTTGGT